MSDNLNSAMEPLLALDRWIRYTQCELQSLRADTLQQRETDKSIQKIQQSQLDALQSQVRELSQQMSEVMESVAELYGHVKHLRTALDHIVSDFRNHFDSLPPTQLASSQGAFTID